MRKALLALLLALSPCFVPITVSAEPVYGITTVQQVDSLLHPKLKEMQTSAKQVVEKKAAIREVQKRQMRLEVMSDQLEAQLEKSKNTLNQDFARIADEPDFDIQTSQKEYQMAWDHVKNNQNLLLRTNQQLQELYAELSAIEAHQKQLKSEIEELEEQKIKARVERLRGELNQQLQLNASFTSVCQENITIAQCSSQAKQQALQKAVRQFQNQLIERTTEKKIVRQNLANVSLNTHVLNQNVIKDGFTGNNHYQSILDVNMESRPAKDVPCRLLNVKNRYCFNNHFESAENQLISEEVQWVMLTIRSNQRQDKVIIDNIDYGSTPIEVMLPVGSHKITIQKEGYASFYQELKLVADKTLKVVLKEESTEITGLTDLTENIEITEITSLAELTENIKITEIKTKEKKPKKQQPKKTQTKTVIKKSLTPKKITDTLKNNKTAPEMIVIGPGQYMIGESATKPISTDKPYAISATPITVSQFKDFVNISEYKTEAEFKATFTMEDISNKECYWRDPGFEQSADSPVVCITLADAIAYTEWLSNETNHNYQLPTEIEWEVAARAGSSTAYWWGDSYKTGQANTGWSNTKWSNISTSPVKSFAPNGYGLYDMVGNVWEWTNNSRGLTKGGAWNFSPDQATAFNRLFISPNTATNYIGFRVVRQL